MDYPCNFTIASAANGGKLTGGFNGAAPPSLQNGDTVTVSVTYPSASGPSRLAGVFVFTPAPRAGNQTNASPFLLDNSNVMCLTTQFASGVAGQQTTVYTFPPMQYGGSVPGEYELTFVAMDQTQNPWVQWSEDPEFDTSN